MDPGMDDNRDQEHTDSGSPDSSLEDPGVSGRLPDLGTTEPGGLWRCNSAPTIAGFGGRISPVPERAKKLEGRRLSYSPSLMNWQTTPMPLSPVRMLSSRVNQIKQEEGGDVMNRETAHERAIHRRIQKNHSFNAGWKTFHFHHLHHQREASARRRSLSPIGCLKPGSIGSNKRKAEGDIELPAKRSFFSAGESSSPDYIATPSSFLHSPSGSSLESESESPSMPPRSLSLSSDPDQIQVPILASAFIPVSQTESAELTGLSRFNNEVACCALRNFEQS
uniref:P2R1A-PPP2R2A-interacting phosphatase regulator 1-like isoform X2 n=1 Tax=Myxine glutinosa TaxID=7769 RepID=UPI00358F1FC5